MKIKEAFKKLEIYNELAELMNEEKKSIWFADITDCVAFGETFSCFADFRKYVRHEYVKDLADNILDSDDWDLNGEKEIASASGRDLTFELCLTAA